jgi:UDP-glucose 4-epimerase
MRPLSLFVVGGAGFIGSHLVDAVLAAHPDSRVTVFDNLSVGKVAFIEGHLASGRASLVVDDALDLEALTLAMEGHDAVVHLAANPEARWGLERTRLDLEQGTIVTYDVLEAMRRARVPVLVFSSSGTVYGDHDAPKSELDLGHLPISLYGASKLACEAMISAFSECFGTRATILRFGNVVGPRGTHGAALDFLKKLAASRVELEVLGDGKQAKPYLHVSDCVRGLLFALDRRIEGAEDAPCAVYNLAPPDQTTVARIAELCVRASPTPDATIRFTGGERGWPGDVPRSSMIGDHLRALGFALSMTSDEAVARAVSALAREVFG